jgi:murein DD-endopeptidase MepM/ murein hydrolase activator NlpD
VIQEKKDILTVLFLGIMTCLTCFLLYEYRFFCNETNRLVALQEQYEAYIEEAYAIIEKQSQEYAMAGEDQWFSPGYVPLSSRDNFDATNVFVNREECYLKESMIAHLKEQGFESLLNRITFDDSINYCNDALSTHILEQPLSPVTKKAELSDEVVIKSGRSVNNSQKSIKKVQKKVTRISGLALLWPIERNRFWLSSFFGPRKNPDSSWGFHRGIDMAALKGTPVRAAASGVVVEARYSSGYGNMIVLQHARKYKTRYAHLDTIGVKVGQKIVRGNVLGTVGDTGLVRKLGKDASHLHFEVCVGDKQVNPLQFFA